MNCENKLGKASALQVGFAGFFCLFVWFSLFLYLFYALRCSEGQPGEGFYSSARRAVDYLMGSSCKLNVYVQAEAGDVEPGIDLVSCSGKRLACYLQ